MATAAETSTKTPITMTDGRIVEFTPKQKLSKTSVITDDAITVRLDFRNGQTRSFVIPDEMVDRFAAHGAEQKLGDAIAGETDEDDQVVAVDDLIARLEKGEWSVGRQGGGFSGQSILMKALVEVSGKSIEQVKAFLEPKTQAEKLALRRSEKLRPTIERLEAEKAKTSKSTVDTSALLGELDMLDDAGTSDQTGAGAKPAKEKTKG